MAAPALLCVLLLAAGTDDWPQFLGPTRDGVYAGAPLVDSFPAGGPPVLWRKKKIGPGWSAPAVAAGKLILFHRLGDRETVECLDAGSGNELWKFEYPTGYRDDYGKDEGPRATPAVSEGRVYTYGVEAKLHCLELDSGRKVFSFDARDKLGARKGFFGAASSPLIEGELLLINVGGTGQKEEQNGIAAFDRRDGKLVWTSNTDDAGYSSPVAANILGRRRALFLTRKRLLDVDPATGAVRFEFPWGAGGATVNAATPLVLGDRVFISSSYGVGAALLKVKDGGVEQVWSTDDVLSSHYATPVHRDGILYGFHGRQEHTPSLRAVEAATGKVRWSENGFGAGTVTLAGDRLWILTEEGELVVAPASPGRFEPLARARVLQGTVLAYPALAEGRLYARSGDTLVCLDLRRK